MWAICLLTFLLLETLKSGTNITWKSTCHTGYVNSLVELMFRVYVNGSGFHSQHCNKNTCQNMLTNQSKIIQIIWACLERWLKCIIGIKYFFSYSRQLTSKHISFFLLFTSLMFSCCIPFLWNPFNDLPTFSCWYSPSFCLFCQ